LEDPDILAYVLAGGQGSRLAPLTAEQAKPALPFAGGVRLIDFVLSNLFLSGVRWVYVMVQYKPATLVEHLRAAWVDRFTAIGGFLQIAAPDSEHPGDQFAGTADAVHRNRDVIELMRPDLVAVFAADHVYRMDVRQMARSHRARHAEVSVSAVRVPVADARGFGVIAADRHGLIQRFEEKPPKPTPIVGDPKHAYCSMGNYLFEPRTLIELLEENAARGGHDFGYHIMPTLPRRRRAYAYDFSENWIPGVKPWEERAYWRDVGTLPALRQAIREASPPRARFELANPRWPILGDPAAGQGVRDPAREVRTAVRERASLAERS
jgi:glucose-1-phosphate adenylyltransferase